MQAYTPRMCNVVCLIPVAIYVFSYLWCMQERIRTGGLSNFNRSPLCGQKSVTCLATMAYIYAVCAVSVTIFSTGSKLWLVSNFTGSFLSCLFLCILVWVIELSCSYRTARSFRGKNFHELVKNTIFMEKTFANCFLLMCQRMPWPQISWRKLSWIDTKPRNLRKFSPSKVSHYTVLDKCYT